MERSGTILREQIPRSVINEALKSLKFDSIDDTRVFLLKDLHIDCFESSWLLIEPYYIPCKARKYLHTELTSLRILTILRQILRSQNYTIIGQEKTTNGIKCMHYQIQPCASTTENSTVTFN